MATQFAGLVYGKGIEDVTYGTATTGKTVEISYNDAFIKDTSQLRDHIHEIIMGIEQQKFPAA